MRLFIISLILLSVRVPLFANFSKPADYGLENVETFYLDGEVGKLGSWYVIFIYFFIL